MMSRYALGELERLLANLIQIGTVTAFNPNDIPPTVQVDLGEQETDPIPISMGRAGSTKDWNPPAIGEQVLVFSPCGDIALAFSLGGLFQDAYPPPSQDSNQNMKVFPDSSSITHDSGSNTMTVTIAGSGNININCVNANVKASQIIKMETPETEISGHLTVNGGMSVTGGEGAKVNGNMTVVNGDVSADDISPEIPQNKRRQGWRRYQRTACSLMDCLTGCHKSVKSHRWQQHALKTTISACKEPMPKPENH